MNTSVLAGVRYCSLTFVVVRSIFAPGMTIFTAPEKRYQGYIFDCDGTLAHSMPIHYLAWKKAVTEAGGQIPEDLFYSLGGVPSRQIVSLLNEKFGYQMDPEALATLKEEYYVDLLTEVTPIEEVARFAREVALFAKVAVASGGILPVVLKTLDSIGFTGFFSVIVTSEQVPRGKPYPDMFLEAARRLGVSPEACVVVEDSPAGFEAAQAAGMDYAIVGRP
ncbi:MAG TPA: HAD family phosphatase [Chthoniobacterales bacterium]|nr:HAD family phosphatase [Chthoniobacterales bacterium]